MGNKWVHISAALLVSISAAAAAETANSQNSKLTDDQAIAVEDCRSSQELTTTEFIACLKRIKIDQLPSFDGSNPCASVTDPQK